MFSFKMAFLYTALVAITSTAEVVRGAEGFDNCLGIIWFWKMFRFSFMWQGWLNKQLDFKYVKRSFLLKR